MATTPGESRFEGVIVDTPRMTRSGGTPKRPADPSTLSTPPSKRSKTSGGRDASASTSSSEAVRVSANQKSITSASSVKRGSSSKRISTATKIGVPKLGDTAGPSNSNTRSSARLSRHSPATSDEDEIAIPVVRSSSRSQSSRSIPAASSIKGKEREIPRNKPSPAFAGKRASSRKKAAISDLMGGNFASSLKTGLEEDEEQHEAQRSPSPSRSKDALHPVPDGDLARQETPGGENSLLVSEEDSSVPSKPESEILGPSAEEPLDSDIVMDSLSSPAASTSTLPPPPDASTPKKASAVPARLVTPSKSSKKLTPTKAVKMVDLTDMPRYLGQTGQSTPYTLPTPAMTPERATVASLDHTHAKEDLLSLFNHVLARLSGPCANLSLPDTAHPSTTDPEYRSWLAGLPFLSPSCAKAERDVRNTLDRTIRDGEGNCLLLVGERGIGKTGIIDRSLQTLASVYGKDGFLVVRLSGLVQRDDKGALKEVARQLCSNAYADDAEEGGNTFTSNATILSSLLAILEPGPSDEQDRAKPLIFLIDEFDLFAHHSVRQSFLYCLLDCVQGGFRRGGMAVIGLSARADCIETLEKRVKSRCQSRVHHLLPAEDIFTGTVDVARQAMISPTQPITEVSEDWNRCVQTFFSDKTVQMQMTAMDELRGLDADRKLFDGLTSLLSDLRYRSSCSTGATSNAEITLRLTDLIPLVQSSERSIPSDLSIAEVAMLIASKHIVEEERPFNFVIAYERYIEHSKRAAAVGTSSSRAYSRGLCLKAFERLRTLGIVKDVSSTSKLASGGGNLFRLCRLVPWPHMIEDAIKERKDIPQHLVKWCKAWSD